MSLPQGDRDHSVGREGTWTPSSSQKGEADINLWQWLGVGGQERGEKKGVRTGNREEEEGQVIGKEEEEEALGKFKGGR